MKLMIIGYVPPISAESSPSEFFGNLDTFPPAHELVLFSPYHWDGRCKQLSCGPELVQNLGSTGMENLKFLTACRVAIANNSTHFLYVDTSCRFVHPNGMETWDRAIWNEFFTRRPYAAVGGSMVVNNQAKDSLAWMRECDILHQGVPFKLPIQYIGTHLDSSVFVNGVLAVYSTHWIKEIFGDLANTVNVCYDLHPMSFDHWMGIKLREKLGFDVFRSVLHMRRIVSTIEPGLLDPVERWNLVSGTDPACAINGIT